MHIFAVTTSAAEKRSVNDTRVHTLDSWDSQNFVCARVSHWNMNVQRLYVCFRLISSINFEYFK